MEKMIERRKEKVLGLALVALLPPADMVGPELGSVKGWLGEVAAHEGLSGFWRPLAYWADKRRWGCLDVYP
jgi:hypothetical protein